MFTNRIAQHFKPETFSGLQVPEVRNPLSSQEDLHERFAACAQSLSQDIHIAPLTDSFQSTANPTTRAFHTHVERYFRKPQNPHAALLVANAILKPSIFAHGSPDPYTKDSLSCVLMEARTKKGDWVLPGELKAVEESATGYFGTFGNAVGVSAYQVTGKGIVTGAIFSQDAFHEVLEAAHRDFINLPPFILKKVKDSVATAAATVSNLNHLERDSLVIVDWQPQSSNYNSILATVLPFKNWSFGSRKERDPFGDFLVDFQHARSGEIVVKACLPMS